MMLGIIWKVEALPTPVMKNMKMNMLRKPHQLAAWIKYMTPNTPSIISTNTQKVTRAPPHLSDTQPVPARLSAPTSGPRNTNCSPSTCGNCCLASRGRPAETPMKTPKVPVKRQPNSPLCLHWKERQHVEQGKRWSIRDDLRGCG